MRCWVLPATSTLRDDPSQWFELSASSPQPKGVSPAASVPFRFAAVDSSGAALVGDFAIKAAATCALDLSNLEPSTGLPCANGSVPWVDLIANDNNLGFCVLRL